MNLYIKVKCERTGNEYKIYLFRVYRADNDGAITDYFHKTELDDKLYYHVWINASIFGASLGSRSILGIAIFEDKE